MFLRDLTVEVRDASRVVSFRDTSYRRKECGKKYVGPVRAAGELPEIGGLIHTSAEDTGPAGSSRWVALRFDAGPSEVLRPSLLVLLAMSAVCLSTVTTPVVAQEHGDLIDLLQGIPEGSRVRLDLRSQPAPEAGRLAGWSDTTLVLVSAEERSVHTLGQVRRLWVGEGHTGGRGAGTGALVGGGIGFGLGVLGRLSDFGGGSSDLDGTTLVVGAAVALPGALIGAGAGYLHGRQRTDWRLRFTSDRSRVGFRLEISTR